MLHQVHLLQYHDDPCIQLPHSQCIRLTIANQCSYFSTLRIWSNETYQWTKTHLKRRLKTWDHHVCIQHKNDTVASDLLYSMLLFKSIKTGIRTTLEHLVGISNIQLHETGELPVVHCILYMFGMSVSTRSVTGDNISVVCGSGYTNRSWGLRNKRNFELTHLFFYTDGQKIDDYIHNRKCPLEIVQGTWIKILSWTFDQNFPGNGMYQRTHYWSTSACEWGHHNAASYFNENDLWWNQA
jgi:hypothetical protein